MKIRFKNSSLAAAFLAAVYAHGPELNGDEPGIGDLSDRGDTLVLTPETDGDYASVDFADSDRDPDHTVNTVADLNRVVPLALAFFTDVLTTEGGGHTVTIHRDGGIQFGCKSFSKEGVERVIAAARRTEKKLKVLDFEVDGHSITQYTEDEEDSKGKIREVPDGVLDFDGDEIEASVILAIAREREEFLKQKPTPKVKWTIDG